MNLLYMLVCLVLIVIAALACQKLVLIREGFDNIGYETTERPVCPTKLKAERKNGQTYCNDEKGLPVCAIIGDDKTKDGVPACHIILDEYFDAQAENFCPPSMPNYFEDVIAKTSGCSTGLLNDTRTAPRDANAPKCIVYNDDQDITVKSSCFNQNQLESTKLFGNNATKTLLSIGGNPSPYITIMQYNIAGQPFANACFPDKHSKRVVQYMKKQIAKDTQATAENKKRSNEIMVMIEQGIDSGKFMLSCEAQKKVFIDHTLNTSDLII